MCNRPQGFNGGSNISLPTAHCSQPPASKRADLSCMSHSKFVEDDTDVEPSSACLLAMVNGFLDTEINPLSTLQHHHAAGSGAALPVGRNSGTNTRAAILNKAIKEMSTLLDKSTLACTQVADIVECVTTSLVTEVSKTGQECTSTDLGLHCVLQSLKEKGYNAALCVTERRPASANGLLPPTTGYKYVDVVMREYQHTDAIAQSSSERVIVDIGFHGHFDIARPLPAYQRLMAMLPSTFVGKADHLQKVVRVMCHAARASLESQGMPLAPWRSYSFLHAKWFSSSHIRIDSVEEASDIIYNGVYACASRRKTRLFVDRHCSSDSANEVIRTVSDWDGCDITVSKPFSSDEGQGAQTRLLCRLSPISNSFEMSLDRSNLDKGPSTSDDRGVDYADIFCGVQKMRPQPNVVSALSLALAELRHDENTLTNCTLETETCGRLRPQVDAVSVV